MEKCRWCFFPLQPGNNSPKDRYWSTARGLETWCHPDGSRTSEHKEGLRCLCNVSLNMTLVYPDAKRLNNHTWCKNCFFYILLHFELIPLFWKWGCFLLLPSLEHFGIAVHLTQEVSALHSWLCFQFLPLNLFLLSLRIQFSSPARFLGAPGMLRRTSLASEDFFRMTSFSRRAVCMRRTLDWFLKEKETKVIQ